MQLLHIHQYIITYLTIFCNHINDKKENFFEVIFLLVVSVIIFYLFFDKTIYDEEKSRKTNYDSERWSNRIY